MAGAFASLTIPVTTGLTAQFENGVQVIPIPGTSPFVLEVDNTGNTQDSYQATITGTSGPITASIGGLDGLPTQTIPTFILPGLSTGALVLDTNVSAAGSGMVIVQVQSLTHPSMTASATALVATATPTPTPTPTPTATPTPSPTPTRTPATTPTPTPTPTPTQALTSPVTVTVLRVEKVKIATTHKAQRHSSSFVRFSGALSTGAAQNLGAYTALSGKTKKVHKVIEVLYNKLIPLTQAIYDSSADTVILLPRGKAKLPKLEQVQVSISVLTDPMGRPINNDQNFNASITNFGFIVSEAGNAPVTASPAPAAAAVDALFERDMFLPTPARARRF